MNRLFCLILLLTFTLTLFMPLIGLSKSVKFDIYTSGVYRVEKSDIYASIGWSSNEIALYNLSLSTEGKYVPYWDDGDFLVFYAEVTNNFFTDRAVYWFRDGPNTVTEYSNRLPYDRTTNVFHRVKVRYEQDNVLITHNRRYTYEQYIDNVWYWRMLTQGLATEKLSFSMLLNDIWGSNGVVWVNVESFENLSNNFKVVINNVTNSYSFIGPTNVTVKFNSSSLQYSNRFTIINGTVPYKSFYLNSVLVEYDKENVDNLLGEIKVGSVRLFVTNGVDIFYISSKFQPQKINGKLSTNDTYISFRSYKSDRYAISSVTNVSSLNFVFVGNDVLKSKTNGANYIVISTDKYKDSVNRLLQYRSNQGYVTKYVNIDSIYNEFNNGQINPKAIYDFVKYAYGNWKIAPKYIVLVGKNSYRIGNNEIPSPTYSWETIYLNDSWMGDINSDNKQDIAIGRIPVTSNDELNRYIDKVFRYEGNTNRLNALMVSDKNDMAGDFAGTVENLSILLPTNVIVDKQHYGNVAQPEITSNVVNWMETKSGLFVYVGHGYYESLGVNILKRGDLSSLTGSNASVFLGVACQLVNMGYDNSRSLAESLLLDTHGGSVVVIGSGSFYSLNDGLEFTLPFISYLYADTVGEAYIKAKGGMYRWWVNQLYQFLGDPAIRINN